MQKIRNGEVEDGISVSLNNEIQNGKDGFIRKRSMCNKIIIEKRKKRGAMRPRSRSSSRLWIFDCTCMYEYGV